MSDGQYVVVFDHLGIATGEKVGDPPLAVSTDHFRGETVTLNKEDAERHLASGAVVKASDPAAKYVKPNPPLNGGVTRNIPPIALEETAPPVSAGEGAARPEASSENALKALTVPKLKERAAALNITVEKGDTKPSLIAKILASEAQPAGVEPGADAGETENPGQGVEPAAPATPPEPVE